MNRSQRLCAIAACVPAAIASAQVTTIDFSVDDGGNVLVNGQDISTPPEFGNIVEFSSPTNALAIFDTTIGGVNDFPGAPDPDLLVDLGNALILQEPGSSGQTVPGIYDTPDDDAAGGIIVADFLSPIELLSIDFIDINGSGQAIDILLVDDNGAERTIFIPSEWTFDISTEGPAGFDTYDFTDVGPQIGEGGSVAVITTSDIGFDITQVVRAEFDFAGSGALDNITLVPAPGSAALSIAAFGLLARRRR